MNSLKQYIEERIEYIRERYKSLDEHVWQDDTIIHELQAVLSKIEEIEQQEFNSLVQCRGDRE